MQIGMFLYFLNETCSNNLFYLTLACMLLILTTNFANQDKTFEDGQNYYMSEENNFCIQNEEIAKPEEQ